MFLLFWMLALAQEITLPVTLQNGDTDPVFARHLRSYHTPDGIRYFAVSEEPQRRRNVILIVEPIQVRSDGIAGILGHDLKSIDRNMTKNYRNRFTGAVTSYVEREFLQDRAIEIREIKTHHKDILWKHYFAASLMVLGMLMGGLLYGALSLSSEWSSGTITFLLVSPRNPWWILAAKEMGILLKGFIGTGIFTVVAILIVPDLSVSLPGIAGALFLGYWIIGLMGMFAGIAVKDPILCFLVALIGSLGLWLMGNGFGTMLITGPAAQILTSGNPATYIMAAIQHFINGTEIDWMETLRALGLWIVLLQFTVFLLYRCRIHLPRGRPS